LSSGEAGKSEPDDDDNGEENTLDQVIACCDCVLTPLLNVNSAFFELNNFYNMYELSPSSMYPSSWNGETFSYLNRSWCRLELFFASILSPLLLEEEEEEEEERIAAFKGEMKECMKERRKKVSRNLFSQQRLLLYPQQRCHFIFGKEERSTENADKNNSRKFPIYHMFRLPSVPLSLFSSALSPEKGYLSRKEKDFPMISSLSKVLSDHLHQLSSGYVGDLRKGKKHGKGKLSYEDGSKYEGEWLNDKKEGKGSFLFTNGDVYEGEFKNDHFHGFGKLIYQKEHSCYEGNFQNGLFHGKGVFFYGKRETPSEVEGVEEKEEKEGFSKQREIMYEGEYYQGKRHGKGKYYFIVNSEQQVGKEKEKETTAGGGRNGRSSYEGDFENDEIHGKGIYSYSNGSRYEGWFQRNHRHGLGKYLYANGDGYEGEFKNGCFHGKGKYSSKSEGYSYEGYYQENKKHGKGKLIINKSGQIIEYDFSEGKQTSSVILSSLSSSSLSSVDHKSVPPITGSSPVPSPVTQPIKNPKSSFCVLS
jgi:hypothetical protein